MARGLARCRYWCCARTLIYADDAPQIRRPQPPPRHRADGRSPRSAAAKSARPYSRGRRRRAHPALPAHRSTEPSTLPPESRIPSTQWRRVAKQFKNAVEIVKTPRASRLRTGTMTLPTHRRSRASFIALEDGVARVYREMLEKS
jgi:hypothetical protein